MNARLHKAKLTYVLILLGIYTLHLGLFDALMCEPFQAKGNCPHYYFDPNSQTDKSHPSIAADYQRILKHEDDKKHGCRLQSFVPVFITTLFALPATEPGFKPAAFLSDKFFHVTNAAFKRYRLLNVFLI